jgi:hypothetical protein
LGTHQTNSNIHGSGLSKGKKWAMKLIGRDEENRKLLSKRRKIMKI